MGSVLTSLLSYILLYKYWALFTIDFIASLGVPLPETATILASSAFAAEGYLNLSAIIGLTILANILADTCMYWVSRLLREKLMNNKRFARRMSSKRWQTIQRSIDRHPVILVVLSRFITPTTAAVNILAGFSEMSFGKFILWALPGEIGAVTLFAFLGYIFGENWQYLNVIVTHTGYIIALGMLIIILLIILKKRTILINLIRK
jgi:membrane protein DedA with SNARE-associated domain